MKLEVREAWREHYQGAHVCIEATLTGFAPRVEPVKEHPWGWALRVDVEASDAEKLADEFELCALALRQHAKRVRRMP